VPLLLVVHHAEPVLQLALALLSLDPHCGRVAPILQGAAALFDVVDFLPGEACFCFENSVEFLYVECDKLLVCDGTIAYWWQLKTIC